MMKAKHCNSLSYWFLEKSEKNFLTRYDFASALRSLNGTWFAYKSWHIPIAMSIAI